MKRVSAGLGLALCIGLVAGCGSSDPKSAPSGQAAEGEITITDMTGREVTLPGTVSHAFGGGPPATSLLYTFGPEYMAGWNSKVSAEQAKFTTDEAAELPVLGRAFGKGGDFNPEELLAHDVDLIIDAGNLDESYVEAADDLSEQTGIPVIQLSTNPEDLSEAYGLMGQVFGDEHRAEKLQSAVDDIVSNVDAGSETVKEPRTIYYGQGADGLSTAPEGSIHSRFIEEIGAENAADAQLESDSGRVDVDFEQVLKWDPDVVILGPDSPRDKLAQDPGSDADFGALDAVKDGDVFVAPAQPFGWVDRPPSVNQLLGMMWAAEAVYPDNYDIDLVTEVKDFYADFYHYEMSEEEAQKMLNESGVDA